VDSGYVFSGPDHITPYLEDAEKPGPTSVFCAELAQRLECYVFAGYPERLRADEIDLLLPPDDKPGDEGKKDEIDLKREVGANCAGVWGPDGSRVALYRKTNLFSTDMTWAKAGKFIVC
jgi:protein N-terminal amidase